MRYRIIFVLICVISFYPRLEAEWEVEIEASPVYSGYNDVRVPNEGGSLISLTDDLDAESVVGIRIRLTYNINEKHTLSLLYAPLSIDAQGQVNNSIYFEDAQFPAGIPLDALYRFDSYRLTYRYHFLRKYNLSLGVGFTAKIRDAEIKLESDQLSEKTTSTGFVPLINFRMKYLLSPHISFILEGDALAGPQGRAEDIMAVFQYQPFMNVAFKAGYRVLEGGADVDQVYNFTLLHYIVFGITVNY